MWLNSRRAKQFCEVGAQTDSHGVELPRTLDGGRAPSGVELPSAAVLSASRGSTVEVYALEKRIAAFEIRMEEFRGSLACSQKLCDAQNNTIALLTRVLESWSAYSYVSPYAHTQSSSWNVAASEFVPKSGDHVGSL